MTKAGFDMGVIGAQGAAAVFRSQVDGRSCSKRLRRCHQFQKRLRRLRLQNEVLLVM